MGWTDRLKSGLWPHSKVFQKFDSRRTLITVSKDNFGFATGELEATWAVDALSHHLVWCAGWGKGTSAQHPSSESL